MTTYQTDFIPISITKLGGGLNTASGPLNLQDNEASDLSNIDFDKFGSFKSRNGYTTLNPSSVITVTETAIGLWWYQTATAQKAVHVSGGKVFRMDDLDGTWDDITGPALTTGGAYNVDFATFNGKVLFTDDISKPQQWPNSGTCSNMTVVAGASTGLIRAKFITIFQNYCLMANVVVDGVDSPTRFYWSAIKDETSWKNADNLEVGFNDGWEVAGVRVWGKRLIC